MTTKESIMEYVRQRQKLRDVNPIYRIMLFEHPDKELIYEKNKTPSGFPDFGSTDEVGFYYDLDHAIEIMNRNVADIRETIYDAGFILCQFPGLYENAGPDARMYFLWDSVKNGYFQQEEPEIFKHIAL